jgi:hypothetical protein
MALIVYFENDRTFLARLIIMLNRVLQVVAPPPVPAAARA